MRRRRSAGVALALLVAAVLSVSAGASTAADRPPGSPDLAAMALALADLPRRAEVDREGYYRDRLFVAAYVREFSLGGARVGRSRLLSVTHDLGVEPTAADAATTFRELRAFLRRRSARETLARELAREAGGTVSLVSVSRPRTPRIGDGSVSIVIRLKSGRRLFQASLTFVRVDRVIGILTLIGVPGGKLYPADADGLARVGAERTRGGFLPALVAPPAVTGDLHPGRVLTATRGTWTGDQLSFSYQWERCSDLASDSEPVCVALPGSNGPSYVVVPGDLALSLRVTVTAENRFARVTAESTPSAVVTGPPGAPVAATPPEVVQLGATLTATAGTWQGQPTEFAYQWRRCDAVTIACTDIAGATEPTYELVAGDSGRRLRVLVVATNAVGPGGALSAPTAPVP